MATQSRTRRTRGGTPGHVVEARLVVLLFRCVRAQNAAANSAVVARGSGVGRVASAAQTGGALARAGPAARALHRLAHAKHDQHRRALLSSGLPILLHPFGRDAGCLAALAPLVSGGA